MEKITETITDADYPDPPSELDYLRIRVGEMAAEIERLNSRSLITEQDAREILENFCYEYNSCAGIDEWCEKEGRDLLNKLNGDQNGK